MQQGVAVRGCTLFTIEESLADPLGVSKLPIPAFARTKTEEEVEKEFSKNFYLTYLVWI